MCYEKSKGEYEYYFFHVKRVIDKIGTNNLFNANEVLGKRKYAGFFL